MATHTNNLNLEKPDKTEQYSIDVFNANADKIDNFAGLTPPRALTADKLTAGVNINGVKFDGSNDIISGLGLYSETQTYNSTDIVYNYINNAFKMFLSKKDNNTGNSLSNTEFWQEVSLSGSVYSLFDLVAKDHVLTYEETNGFAQLGGFVYKNALAGSRYGYPDFYNKCVEEKENATITELAFGDNSITIYTNSNGHKFYDIADKSIIDEIYNTYGVAWYYGIDTENECICLPRNDGNKRVLVESKTNGADWYNLYSDGWCEQGGYYTGTTPTVEFAIPYKDTNYNASFQSYYGAGGGYPTVTEYTTSYIKYNPTSAAGGLYTGFWYKTEGYTNKIVDIEQQKTYMVVGNTTSTDGLTDVVAQGTDILNQVNQGIETRVKLDGSNAQFAHIIETYQNGSSWYRIYSDGWCEQGGGLFTTGTVTFLKQFKDTNITLLLTRNSDFTGAISSGFHGSWTSIPTTTGFTCFYDTNTTYSWQASGYLAQGEY